MTPIIRLQLTCNSRLYQQAKHVVGIFFAMLISVTMFMSCIGLSLAFNLP